MFKACKYCGRIHKAGEKCGKYKRIYPITTDRRLRQSYAWEKKSKEIKQSAQGLCEVCRAHGQYTYTGLEAHHIVKLKDNPDGLLDNYNLVCLCVEHHKQADAGQISTDYLRQLAKEREEQ